MGPNINVYVLHSRGSVACRNVALHKSFARLVHMCVRPAESPMLKADGVFQNYKPIDISRYFTGPSA